MKSSCLEVFLPESSPRPNRGWQEKIGWPLSLCAKNQHCDHSVAFRESDKDGRSMILYMYM